MPEITVDVYDIAENDRGELLLAIPDQSIDADAARFSFNGPDLILHYDDARTLRLPQVPEAVRPQMKNIREILVVESGESAVYPAQLAAAVPVGQGPETVIEQFEIEELTPPAENAPAGAQAVIAISFPLTHRGMKSAQFSFIGDDLVLHFPSGASARLPNVQADMRARLLAMKQAMITEGGLVRAYDARNIEPPARRSSGRTRH